MPPEALQMGKTEPMLREDPRQHIVDTLQKAQLNHRAEIAQEFYVEVLREMKQEGLADTPIAAMRTVLRRWQTSG